MKHNNCYIYPKTNRELIDGLRHYDTGKEKLPSVTTIIQATQSEEKQKSLFIKVYIFKLHREEWIAPAEMDIISNIDE